MLKPTLLACLTVSVAFATGSAQDTSRARVTDSAVAARPDTNQASRLHRARRSAATLARSGLSIARQGERVVFGADSAVERWTSHDDGATRVLRRISPVAFWVPVAVVVTTPVVWADEAQDGNDINAQYARSATAALALGFLASRTAKHFIHRARPCTGQAPGVIIVGALPDSLPRCGAGSHVAGYTSFFSEHTVALFAIASAATFHAQRLNDRNAAPIAAVAFTGASVFSIGRIYQHQHWLSDVLVGAAVGTASGWLGAQLGPHSSR